MKYFFTFLLAITTSSSFCQKGLTSIKSGVYTGGICLDEGICGNWILKSDSTFAFIEFKNALVKKIGFGTIVKKTASKIKLNFNSSSSPILFNSNVEYSSKSVSSYDSVYFKGKIINDKNEAIKFATIVYNSKYSTETNDSGYFSAKFPRFNNLNFISVIKVIDQYPPIKIYLSPNNNSHELNILLPFNDSLSCISFNNIEKKDDFFTFKIFTSSNSKRDFLSLYFVSSKFDELNDKLIYAKELQPLISKNIEELINFMNKK